MAISVDKNNRVILSEAKNLAFEGGWLAHSQIPLRQPADRNDTHRGCI